MIAFDYNYINLPNLSIEERFKIKFKPISRPLKTWKEELLISAKTISESTPKPLYVIMSGGIDSEQVARLYLELGIKFKALTVVYDNEINSHDIHRAIKFCRDNNIEHIKIPLNPETFYNEGINRYISQGYRSTNIYHYLQLFIIENLEELGGFGVGGAGEQVYYNIDNQLHLKINPHYTLGIDFCKNNNLQHNFWMNLSTPEIYASYTKIDLIDFLLQRPEYFLGKYPDSVEKMLVYSEQWPMMERRGKNTGFERIEMTIRQPIQRKLKEMFPDLVDLYYPVSKMKQDLGI